MTLPITPTDSENEVIDRAVQSAPRNSWELPELSRAFQSHALQTLFYNGTVTLPGRIAGSYLEKGFAVVDFAETFRGYTEAECKKALALVMFSVGKPFGTYKRVGFWQTLGVNYDAKQGRAQSTGYIPLHMDFDQVENPPEGVALFKRRDVATGTDGDSLVFDYRPFVKGLDEETRERLLSTTFRYEDLFDVNGLGNLINPHPFMTLRANGSALLRYNGKAALGENSPAAQELFATLEPQFRAQSTRISLKKGHLLLLDQTSTLHGREALERDVDARPDPRDDRELWQCYLRHQRR